MTSPTTRLALHVGAVGAQPQLAHPEQDAALHRLQAVAGVGQGAGVDDAVGVLEEGAAHLLLDVDVDDPLGEARRRGRRAAARHGVGLLAWGRPILAHPARRPGRPTGTVDRQPVAAAARSTSASPCGVRRQSAARQRARHVRTQGCRTGPHNPRAALHGPQRARRTGPTWTTSAGPRCRASATGSSARATSWPSATTPTIGGSSGMPNSSRTASCHSRRHPEEQRAQAGVVGGRAASASPPCPCRCPSRAPASGSVDRSVQPLSGCGVAVEVGVRVGAGRARARARPHAAQPGVRRAAVVGGASRTPPGPRPGRAGDEVPALAEPGARGAHGQARRGRATHLGAAPAARRVEAAHHAAAQDDLARAPRSAVLPARRAGWDQGGTMRPDGRTSRWDRRVDPVAVGGRRRPARRHGRARAADPPGRRRRHPPLPRRAVRRVDLPALLRAAARAERRRRAAGSRTSTTPTGSPSSRRCASEIIGIGRYDRIDARSAEVAFNISDHYQGKGIGSVLLEHLAAIAQELGIARFTAEVLPQNRKMLYGLLRRRLRRQAPRRGRRRRGGVRHRADRPSKAVAMSREHRAEALSVRSILHPGTIAVIGASRRPGSIGSQLLDRLVDGRVHRVRSTR